MYWNQATIATHGLEDPVTDGPTEPRLRHPHEGLPCDPLSEEGVLDLLKVQLSLLGDVWKVDARVHGRPRVAQPLEKGLAVQFDKLGTEEGRGAQIVSDQT